MSASVSKSDISNAYDRIAAHVRRTPILTCASGTFGLPLETQLKLEFLQHTGSFKPRGAFNSLLTADVPPAGVAAASGGNHGAAVAYAARTLGHPARIFVPEISSPVKIAKIRAAGAEVVVEGARYADALALCEEHIAQTGALSIHAYDAAPTIAGQGSVGLEFEAQCPDLDTVLVAVGGGGLISGIAAWYSNGVKVVGVEPEGSCALHAALAAGGPIDVGVDSIAADSLGARNTGALVHSIADQFVDSVVLVPDAAIELAQKRLWAECQIVAEPGGAAALAALLTDAYTPRSGEKVGVLVCGANTGFDAFTA
ncbi:MAG: threonine/serine dehydratase [Pseudomonadota bacterium]